MSTTNRLWNIIVYLAGDNNLREECVFALKEMKKARANGNHSSEGANDAPGDDIVRVVAQLDASGGEGGPEPRYIIDKSGGQDGTDELGAPLLTRFTAETSYREVLREFIFSSIKYGPAQHYMVVLSGHGSGTDGDFLSKDSASDAMSFPKLQWVFEHVKRQVEEVPGTQLGQDGKIDILGMDTCLMNMAEVCYELRHHVRYMVGAEGFEPNSGWPFKEILRELLSQPSVTPEELARMIVAEYVAYYRDYILAGVSVDQAACDLRQCDSLAAAVKNLVVELKARLSDRAVRNAILMAHWKAQTYKYDQYADLYDFCQVLEEELEAGSRKQPELKRLCQGVRRALLGSQAVPVEDDERADGPNGHDAGTIEPFVLKSCYSGPAVQYSFGLSIYFPWSKISEEYKKLEFAQATGWHEFLQAYVEATRREARQPQLSSGEAAPEPITMDSFFNPLGIGFPLNIRNSVEANRNSVEANRLLANSVGSMKNPPLTFFVDDCNQESGSEAKSDSSNVEPSERHQKTKTANARRRSSPRRSSA